MIALGMLDLPNEIIHHICMKLRDYSGYHDTKALSQLSRTCRAMRDVVQHLVYHHLKITYGSGSVVDAHPPGSL